jgi:hypothetical protein
MNMSVHVPGTGADDAWSGTGRPCARLRSKSLDRNSYDSGDWFNRIDWSGRESTFGSGLPPARDNLAKWPYMQPLLADPALRPVAADMQAAHARAQDLLGIRFSSLFRLGSAPLVHGKVSSPRAGGGRRSGGAPLGVRRPDGDVHGAGPDGGGVRIEEGAVMWISTAPGRGARRPAIGRASSSGGDS